MTFSDIIGQQELVNRLTKAVCGVPGHAYAFLGPQGSGRRLLARAFAKALLCSSTNDGESCNQCDSCRYFNNGVHPDFTFVAREGKDKNIKVERVRHAITADVAMKPQMARHKVYLIMADDLNEPGQNALLKS
ncbi:MAG: DNA polymerase III subunit delta', partial [Ruminococcaceae bacterium]|nr:DNA polymerase III subunit delta' [Oscillospiraceae bacterium]